MAKQSTQAPAPTEAAEAPAKEPKVALEKQNDVTKPREGSKTRRVWDIATEISDAKGSPATIGEVKEKAGAEGLNDSTVQTQYNRWRKFYGLPPQGRAKKAEPEATEEANSEATE